MGGRRGKRGEGGSEGVEGRAREDGGREDRKRAIEQAEKCIHSAPNKAHAMDNLCMYAYIDTIVPLYFN